MLRVCSFTAFNDPRDFEWNSSDAKSAAQGMLPSQRIIYRALRAISALHVQQNELTEVKLDALLSKTGMEVLFDELMHGLALQQPSGSSISVFRLPGRGAFAAIMELTDSKTRLRLGGGVKEEVLLLANQLPDHPIKTKLLASLNDDTLWGWGKTDGDMILDRGTLAAPIRHIRANFAIAKALNLISGRERIALSYLNSYRGYIDLRHELGLPTP